MEGGRGRKSVVGGRAAGLIVSKGVGRGKVRSSLAHVSFNCKYGWVGLPASVSFGSGLQEALGQHGGGMLNSTGSHNTRTLR